MTTLSKGQNIAISATTVRAVLSWSPRPGTPDVDASALLLSSVGKVRGDDDMVFYNQPVHASGAVKHGGKQSGSGSATDTVAVDLSRVESGVERIVVAASADGGSFGQVPGLSLALLDVGSGTELARFDITDASTETAFVFGELYRRGGWKFRAVGQGYASGLAGLATDFGISVDDEPAPAAAPRPASATPAPAAPAPTAQGPTPPSSGRINLDKGRVSLQKNQSVSLVKTGAPALTAVTMGLGWDPAKGSKDIDLDASALAYDAKGKHLSSAWFMKLKIFDGAIEHTGDNLTGAGEGDDEQIRVFLDRLPAEVHGIVFTVNSFRGQKFTEVKRAFCRLIDTTTGAELVRFDLTDSEPRTGVVMATLVRGRDGVWVMKAVGQFHDGKSAKAMKDPGAAALAG